MRNVCMYMCVCVMFNIYIFITMSEYELALNFYIKQILSGSWEFQIVLHCTYSATAI